MIDIHTHVLPCLDDGPASMEESIALVSAAAGDGTRVIVATPHIRGDYPFDLGLLPSAVQNLNEALASAGVEVRIVGGGEVSLSKAAQLDDAELRALTLGGGDHLLVESPYSPLGSLLENTLFDLQVRGYVPVLAHPERSPVFQRDLERLQSLVARGALCSITAGSVTGRFGRHVQRVTRRLLELRLVHNMASDAHDVRRRPPGMSAALAALGRPEAYGRWLAFDAPQAIVEGRPLPERPDGGAARRRGWRSRLSGHNQLETAGS